MNPFSYEKQQINCTCFNISPKTGGRIFRSGSHYPSGNPKKNTNLPSERTQSQNGKNKKKSLKKQKPYSQVPSQQDFHQKQQPNKQVNIQFSLNYPPSHPQKKLINFDYFEYGKVPNQRSEKIKNAQFSNRNHSNPPPQPVSLHFVRKVYDPVQLKKHHEQLVSHEFQKDLYEFKLYMQKRQSQKKVLMKNMSSSKQLSADPKIQPLNLAKLTEKLSTNTQRIVEDLRIKNMPHSFRTSGANSARQKQSLTKRLKQKMMPKEIQSQGSSMSSDRVSEVLGRGFDQLTEHRLEFEEFSESLNKKETMETQESHIKHHSDFSNSFLSPNSVQNGTEIRLGGFGGGKYQIGKSSLLLDNIIKNRNSSQSRINF